MSSEWMFGVGGLLSVLAGLCWVFSAQTAFREFSLEFRATCIFLGAGFFIRAGSYANEMLLNGVPNVWTMCGSAIVSAGATLIPAWFIISHFRYGAFTQEQPNIKLRELACVPKMIWKDAACKKSSDMTLAAQPK